MLKFLLHLNAFSLKDNNWFYLSFGVWEIFYSKGFILRATSAAFIVSFDADSYDFILVNFLVTKLLLFCGETYFD
jgi:hypothetical protein